jgi:hypothetical protein
MLITCDGAGSTMHKQYSYLRGLISAQMTFEDLTQPMHICRADNE